jgi:hypothetical protein
MGGNDDNSNIVKVTVTQHAMFHYANWRLWGNREDYIAWKALAGFYNKEEVIHQVMIVGTKKGGNITKELGIGVHGLSKEQIIENSKKGAKLGGEKSKELGIGIHSQTPEERREWAKLAGKVTNSQKWMCEETGYISTPGGLSQYQRARGIDTSKRKRIIGPLKV